MFSSGSLQSVATVTGNGSGSAGKTAVLWSKESSRWKSMPLRRNLVVYSVVVPSLLCLIDTIGCGLEGLRFKECARLLGPVVEGTTVPNGTQPPSAR